jgi:superfamily II DNA or RNA helicase
MMKRAERHQLGAVIEQVRAWVNTAHEARQLAAHLPVSGSIVLSPDDHNLLTSLERVDADGALGEASRLSKAAWLDGRKSLQPAHQAADLVVALHRDFTSLASDARLAALRGELSVRAGTERETLQRILGDVSRSRLQAKQMRHNAAHLPLTSTPVKALTSEEDAAAQSIVQVTEAHHQKAALLLGTSACGAGRCADAHTSAQAVAGAHAKACEAGHFDLIEQADARVSTQLSSELGCLPGILANLSDWRSAARQARTDSEHLPLTEGGVLSEREAEVIGELAAVYDANIEAARAFRPSRCETGACGGLHQPLAALGAYHVQASVSGNGDLIARAADRIAGQMLAERETLSAALTDLDTWHAASLRALHDAEHMPLTRSGVLSDSERAAMRTIDSGVIHRAPARAHLDATDRRTGTSHDHRRSAALLVQFHADSLRYGVGTEVVGAAQRVAAQSLRERSQVARLHKKVTTWPDRVEAIARSRADATSFSISRIDQLVTDSVPVRLNGTPMGLLPVHSKAEGKLVASLALLTYHPLLEADKLFLTRTAATANSLLSAFRTGFTPQWECRGEGTCDVAHSLLPGVYEEADAVEDELNRLDVVLADMPHDIDLLPQPRLGFTDVTPSDRRKLAAIVNAASAAREAADNAHAAADDVRAEDVENALKAMELDTLKKASPQDKFRVTPLEAYGVRNVWDVLQFQQKYDLASVSGLGELSARAIVQAALRLSEAVRDDTPVRIDVKRRSERTAALLVALRRWDTARKFNPTEDELALAEALTDLFLLNPSADRAIVVAEWSIGEPPHLLAEVLASVLDRVPPPLVADVDIWQDFLSRPADYFGMLTELGFTTEDEKKMHGDLTEEIIEAVRAQELRRDFLTASLRAYQSFGARFALAQEKVVIGDEMGLGKTVQALAVLAHLRATGHSHFLVVCPAAVVGNWIRETEKHSKLSAIRLHGSLMDRHYAAKAWIRNGGVAVTTYDLLPWAQEHINQVDVGCAVFDEAHYIKNPDTNRSLASVEVMDSVKYVMLMTGTPMENRVQEFRNLIGYIRPDLSESAPEFLASRFRKHVAPVYLRRNQQDVLTELPERVEIDEWLGMSDADERAYRLAVEVGHFADMRRAAMLSGRSLKMGRLLEIVEEARANGRRVIVFSYFRDVLSAVANALPGQVFGPLTGSTPATDRLSLVDRFSQAKPGAVLVGQIKAAGEGLNMQSASVVVICEPQLKPTMEWQAIARAHRMGQTHTVEVHRLLTENSVDERICELLARKQQLFEEFARDSVIAEQAPDAVDISEAEFARIVVAAERERLFGQT